VDLPPQTAQQLALILHELSSNAVEHGALSSPGGRISIAWSLVDGTPPMVDLTWREAGGPKVTPPVGRGFGLTLIERSRALPNLKTSIDFEPGGVVVHVSLQARTAGESDLFNPGERLLRPRVLQPRSNRTAERRILIMDGSLSRALLLEDMLETAGFSVSGPMATAQAAVAELSAHPADLVTVDVDEIADSEITRLLIDLAKWGIPCIAIGTSGRLAQIKAGAFSAIVAKPIERDSFLRAVSASLNDDIEAGDDLM
jgi:CheY-like chemotaxis protein